MSVAWCGSLGLFELSGVIITRCGEADHALFGEVAANDHPFVVLVKEDGPDEADDSGVVTHDPHDVRAGCSTRFFAAATEGTA